MKQLMVRMVLAFLVLTGCNPSPTRLSKAEATAYAAEVDAIVENMLVGFSQNDHAMATRDCDESFQKFWNESKFRQDYENMIPEIGSYQTKTLDYVEDDGDFREVAYKALFEKKAEVIVKVFFYIEDPEYLITGISFSYE